MKYMGISSKHASSVPLVLNPSTGTMTPQYHVVFDDWFATVSSTADQLPDFNSDEWAKMFGNSAYQYPLDDDELARLQAEASPMNATSDDIAAEKAARHRDYVTPTPLPVVPPPMSPASSVQRERNGLLPSPLLAPSSAVNPMEVLAKQEAFSSPISSDLAPPSPAPLVAQPPPPSPSLPVASRKPSSSPPVQPSRPATKPKPTSTSTSSSSSSPPSGQRRYPNRPREAPNRLTPTALGQYVAAYDTVPPEVFSTYFHEYGIQMPPTYQFSVSSESLHKRLGAPSAYHMHVRNEDLGLYKASNSDPDTLSFDEAMRDADRDEWRQAAAKEIQDLEAKSTWREVSISEVPSTETILPGTWVFRRKRTPDGTIKKYKGRYCVRGDLQKGDFETFAPVVAFSTVRLFLVLSLKLKWSTCSIDFANAFVQAELKTPVWIHLPRGFRSKLPGKTCLKLLKSLYGLSEAPRLWNLHLFETIKALGFVQSKIDPCLMMKKDIFIVFFCDDTGVAAKSEAVINELVQALIDKGFELSREETFSEFLGIKYDELSDGSISMTQKGLINKIISATDMESCNPKHTPALKCALGIDSEGAPMNETWNYASIVGMLLYLSTNTRPDIAFAVSQVARYTHHPKSSHAVAVKHLIRYLSKTKDQGIIVKPTNELALDCYVDADFAGRYGRDPDDDPTSVKSRTGYIIKLGGCPVFWKSQLQSCIALSTAEAEYVALSQSLRVVLPMKEMLLEIMEHVDVPSDLKGMKSTIRATVFEDNNSALALATTHRVTNRTRYYAVKWHWFWDAVRNNKVKIEPIATNEQDADYLTKGLVQEPFESNRKSNQGW